MSAAIALKQSHCLLYTTKEYCRIFHIFGVKLATQPFINPGCVPSVIFQLSKLYFKLDRMM